MPFEKFPAIHYTVGGVFEKKKISAEIDFALSESLSQNSLLDFELSVLAFSVSDTLGRETTQPGVYLQLVRSALDFCQDFLLIDQCQPTCAFGQLDR